MSSNAPQQPSSIEVKSTDYSKLFPIITGMLLILGISRLMIFYGLFGVRILSFLDFGEIITSFFDVIFNFITSLLLAWIILNIYSPKNKEKQILPLLPPKEQNEEQYNAYIHKKLKYLREKEKNAKKQLYAAAVSVLLLLICVFIPFVGNYKEIFLLIIMLVVVFSLTVFLTKTYRNQESKLLKDLCRIAIVFVMAEGMTIYISTDEYYRTKDDKKYLGTRITFNNEIQLKDSSHLFISDSTNFYIGKTNSYIFIYHMKESIISVYPMSTVVQIDFRNSPPKASGNIIRP